jgi:hypothetical protein
MEKKLKISHLASTRQLAELLSNFQTAKNCEVKSLFYNQSINLSDHALLNTDILHIHGVSLLENPDLLRLINNRLSSKQVVIISIFLEDNTKAALLEKALADNQELLEESTAIFLQDTSLLSRLDSLENWSWCASPVNSNIQNPQEFEFESKDTLEVLFLEDPGSQDYKEIVSTTVKKLGDEGFNFNLKIIDPSSIEESSLSSQIKACDILIESPLSPAVSSLALEALAAGKTVLAAIPENSSNITRQFEAAPILKTDASNLFYRLKSLAKEPKSMRDFGRRGLKYIHDYHNPEQICRGYLEIYRQFV